MTGAVANPMFRSHKGSSFNFENTNSSFSVSGCWPMLGRTFGAGHRMVTKFGPLCKVKLLKNEADKAVVSSPGWRRRFNSVPGHYRSPRIKSCVFLSLKDS